MSDWPGRVGAVLVGLLVPAVVAAVGFVAVPSVVALVLPATCAGAICLIGLAARLRGSVRPWIMGMAFGAALSLTWWVAAAIPVGPVARQHRPHTHFWHLSTGSTIGYTSLPTQGSSGAKSPAVILHGGPGVADTSTLVRFAGSLGLTDRSVYIYDEVGAGSSSRLDPKSYGPDRDVEDLEAIRATIRASRMVLIGHSYGAYLATSYAARHPDRVERLVLASPGPMSSDDHSPNRLQDRLSLRTRLNVLGYALRPRQMTTYLMSRWDPTRARRVVPDSEADAMSDELTRRAAPALYCQPGASTQEAATGAYRMQVDPLPPSTQQAAILRRALPNVSAPTMILKGSCDYLSWESAMDYRRLLHDSRLCLVEGAGHNLLEEQVDQVAELVRRFIITGQKCPKDWSGAQPPSYQGRPR